MKQIKQLDKDNLWKLIIILGLIIGMISLTGCAKSGTETTTPTLTNTLPPGGEDRGNGITVEPTFTSEPKETKEVNTALKPFITSAKDDLASQLDVPANEIEVVEAQMVTWPDGSAGCPSPNIDYIQVQEEGLIIQLVYKGQVYEYHQSQSRPLFLCKP